MSPEGAVERIQESAAVEGAQAVAQVAAVGDAVIAGEVAAVGDDLEEHAELSEERHEEILEGESWQAQRLEALSTILSSLQAQLTALQAQQGAGLTQGTAILELLNLRLPDLRPMTPPPEAPPPPEVVAIVETPPESGGGDGSPVVRTESEPRRPRRRLI